MTLTISPNDVILMTIDEVADFLQVSPRTVRRLIEDEKLSACRVERQLRVHRKELTRFLWTSRIGEHEYDL